MADKLLREHRKDRTLVKYLERLNPGQRSAVEHGILRGDTSNCGPLLIIAGAGSGKTKRWPTASRT